MRATSHRLTVGSLRELSTVGVVSALGATYAAALLSASNILGAYGRAEGGSAGIVLGVVSAVFIAIALFVSAIVISNGVDTVIAGRHRQLALLRLIGATSSQLRASLVRAVAIVAGAGAVVGVLAGSAGATLVRIILVRNGTLPDTDYALLPPGAVVAGLAVLAVAVGATVVGAHRPLAASAALRPPRRRVSRVRPVMGLLAIAAGAVGLVAAALLGEQASLAGFGMAFLGAATVSVGILLGASRIVPRLVAVCGLLTGRGPSALLARKNAVSDPLRTTRSTIGLLIGVTLVTTIAAGMSSLSRSVRSWEGMTPDQVAETERTLTAMSAVLLAMVAISAVIAGVGFVSTMSLTVIGRTREIGMLRAMGFTARQVRSMIVTESVALSGTAVAAGLVLGITFGAVGSQSLIGSQTAGIPVGLPWPVLAAIVAGTVALVAVASLPPGRRAVAVSPVDALAVT